MKNKIQYNKYRDLKISAKVSFKWKILETISFYSLLKSSQKIYLRQLKLRFCYFKITQTVNTNGKLSCQGSIRFHLHTNMGGVDNDDK